MAEKIEIRVPDIGDFTDVEVIDVMVEAGDDVAVDDPLITLETDKASMDVPSTATGRIESVAVSVGDKVSEGSMVVLVAADQEAAGEVTAAATEDEPGVQDSGASPAPDPGESASDGGRQPVLVPDIGDFSDVDVIEVHVEAGDSVSAEDPLITLETDKASMDVPAPAAGTVEEMLVNTGDKVSQGDVVLVMVTEGAAAPAPPTAPSAEQSAAARAPATTAQPAPASLPPIDEASFARAHASPAVRRLARELGVDLGRVSGSGRKGRVTAADVKAFVKSVMSGQAAVGAAPAAAAALPAVPVVDFAKFGEIDTVPLTRIQKISGPRLHASWVNLPHVTQFDDADITDLEERRQVLKAKAAQRGARLTPLAFLVVACVKTLQEYPQLNASLSPSGDALVYKKYFHIGFAADTPNGLMVPVIKNADQKSLMAIAKELGDLSAKARDGKLAASDLQGGTFTISSLGSIGGTAFTPIINAPEVAILGVSRSSMQPVYQNGAFVPRLMLPLSLSYDHRVIDGALAVRFTTFLAAQLADPDGLLLN